MLVLSLVLASIILFYIYNYVKFGKFIDQFPGPIPLPILGNTHQLGFNSVGLLNAIFILWEKYGVTFRCWLGSKAYIMISDPKDVETILSSRSIIEKGQDYNYLHDWLGQGLLTSKGKYWHSHRKTITPSFHFSILLEYYNVMNRISEKFIEILKPKADSGDIFDIQTEVHFSTLDIICETAMGVNIKAMDDRDSEIVSSYHDLCHTTSDRGFNLIKRNDFLYQFTSDFRKRRKALNVLKQFTTKIIKNRNEILKKVGDNQEDKEICNEENEGHKTKKTFLDTLLTEKIKNSTLTFEEVYEEVSTFLFEGHDTTSSALTFALYMLSKNPEVQMKAFEEQKRIFGDSFQSATYQQISDMKYLELVIKETLRLFPSVPMIIRETKEPVIISGKYVPANTSIAVLIVTMGYNEKYFPEPNKFDPERFDSANWESVNPFLYVPFSAGPRNCIGQKFALLEIKCVLSKIIRNFEILPAKDFKDTNRNGYNKHQNKNSDEPCLATALTLKSVNGVNIKLRSRNRNQ